MRGPLAIKRSASAGPRGRRGGYALLAVLWLVVGVLGLVFTISAAAKAATAASRNRVNLTRAAWEAHECLAYGHAAISRALADAAPRGHRSLTQAWNDVDRLLYQASPDDLPCEFSARAVGSRLDVNAADEETLARVFRIAGAAPNKAESLAAAIADWRDPDDQPRIGGAEAGWYEANGRPGPANRSLTSLHELRLIRGLETSRALDSLLDVEPGPISLVHAPPAVLALLPGLTIPAIAWITAVRRADSPLTSLVALSHGMGAERPTFEEALPRLAAIVVLEPKAWIVTARRRVGRPPVTVATEVRIARSGDHATVVRRRSWTE